ARLPGGLWVHSDPLLNKPFYPNGLVTGILTWCQKGLGFESRRVRLGGYGSTLTRYLISPSIPMARLPGGLWAHSDPLLNKPFYPNGLVTGILTWCQKGLGFESRYMHM
ncbi:unnamed protein product, partial [Closterium sp. NIES-54]